MFCKTPLLLVAAAAGSLVSAQSGSSTASGGSPSAASGSSASRTSSASPTATSGGTQVVSVGKGGVVFDPSEIKADVGTWIEFRFVSGNHSVVQSSFDDPCEPLSGNTRGIFSDFNLVSSDATEFPTYTIRVNSTDPMWLYCSQSQHCQNGMVAVVNPPSGRTLAQYAAEAKDADSNETPQGGAFGGVAGTSSESDAGSGSGASGTESGATPSGSGSAGSSAASSTRIAGWLLAAGVMAAGAFMV